MIWKDDRNAFVEIFNKLNNNSNCSFPYDDGNNERLDTFYSNKDTVDFYLSGIGITLLTFFGIPANVLSLKVLIHPTMKSSLTTLLLGLTISDIVVIGSYFLTVSLDVLLNGIRLLPYYYTHVLSLIYPWIYPIAGTAQLSSIYFTVTITLERYIAMCHPLKACTLCTRSNAFKSAFVVVFVTIMFNVPRWFEYESIEERNCDNQVLWYNFTETDFGKSESYQLYYVNWAHDIAFVYIPFFTLVYFNVRTYGAVKRHLSMRTSLMSIRTWEKSENVQLAGMLLGIVLTFFVCYGMDVVYTALYILGMEENMSSLRSLQAFLRVFSHSSNFIFYCAFGTRFRQQLLKLLCMAQNQKGGMSTESVSTSPATVSCTFFERVNQHPPSSPKALNNEKKQNIFN